MRLQHALQFLRPRASYRADLQRSGVDAPREGIALVQHVGYAAGHARGEVVAHGAEDGRASAGHVLAAVVAHALGHGRRAGIAHAEALARRAGYVGRAAGRAVEGHVANERVAVAPPRALGRAHRQRAAGEALAQVVVGLAAQRDLLPLPQERAKRLPAAAVNFDIRLVL